MKAIVKLFALLAIALAPSVLIAQTEVTTVNDIKWRLMPLWPQVSTLHVAAINSSGDPLSEGISTGILRFEDNSIISNVQLDANDYGVVRLNKDLSTQWLTNVDGYTVAIGMFNGNLLVICSDQFSSFYGISNILIGYLIDPKTGKIITRKELYNGGDQFYQEPVFLYAPNGSFFKLAVRTSIFTRTAHNPLLMFNMNKVADQYFTSGNFELLDFDAGLNVKSTIKPVLEAGYFLGGTINKNGDVFLMTEYSQGYLKIAKYEDGKTAPAKVLQETINMDDAIISNLKDDHLFTSRVDPSVIFFAGTYLNGEKDRELDVIKFNFKDGTVSENAQVMDKAYFKDLAKAYVPFSKKFDDVNLGPKDEMKIQNVIENDGKLIVGLTSYNVTYNTMTSSPPTTRAFDLLINIYDEKANLQYQQIIPRTYTTFVISRLGIGMHCSNNTLFITANNNKGLAGFKTLYSTIDLKSGAITNITGIPKPNVKSYYGLDPYATFWFDKQFVVSYLQEKGLFDSSEDAHMQLLNY